MSNNDARVDQEMNTNASAHTGPMFVFDQIMFALSSLSCMMNVINAFETVTVNTCAPDFRGGSELSRSLVRLVSYSWET